MNSKAQRGAYDGQGIGSSPPTGIEGQRLPNRDEQTISQKGRELRDKSTASLERRVAKLERQCAITTKLLRDARLELESRAEPLPQYYQGVHYEGLRHLHRPTPPPLPV